MAINNSYPEGVSLHKGVYGSKNFKHTVLSGKW
jgi:hypothetical protein